MYVDEKTGQMTFIEPLVEYDKETRLWREFLQFHNENPHIYGQYKAETMKILSTGREVQSFSLITECHRSEKRFKISNNHTAYYARLFIEEFPQYKAFFKLRPVKKD